MRPSIVIVDQPDESFAPWQAPLVQRAFSQVEFVFKQVVLFSVNIVM